MKCSSVPIGAIAPDFAFTDDRGASGRLSEYQGRCVVLVFFRGHWCQSCRRQLAQLATAVDTMRSLGSELLAISSDGSPPSDADSRGLPIVVDADLRIIDQYGVRDRDAVDGRQIARPAVFILDPAGVVRFCHVGSHRQDRPAVGAILLAIESISERHL
jgi:peroxiredoxin